jgi:Cdc6-like AAA superfamily ATPase
MALSDTNNNYKNDTDTRISTDEPTKEAEDFREYSRKLSKIIINSEPRFTVGIYGEWGTGKTTIMQMIKEELDKNYSDNLETIWFDSWRYEREKYSAMIPLLRTIILTLESVIVRSKNNNKKKILQKVQKGFVKIIKAVIRNTELNINEIVGAGLTFDFGKILEEYASEGNVRVDQEKITFHKHVSDNLKEELDTIKKELNSDFRLIIFIDDLDRCTPERALEILESIKTFFDIEGIIYVIGIDPQTIGPIIKTKYENNPKIDGMHYLQKIVQLPFQIPVWSSVDLSNVIRNLVKEARLSESYSNEILKKTNQELIIKATQLNPRDIKRFINSIVLARDIYGQHNIRDIDKIIAIQAFYFHGHKWIEFLKLLIPYEHRIKFLMHFISLKETKLKDITVLDDLRKIIEDEKYKEKEKDYLYMLLVAPYREDKSLNEIYKKLIEIDDNDLFTFLKIASRPLLEIDKIESYLRIVDNSGITIERKDLLDIDSEKQLKLLQNQKVEEFNDYVRSGNVAVHLPYAVLHELKTTRNKISLFCAF